MEIKKKIREEWAIVKEFRALINDTIKKDGKYSKSNLMMANAWWAVMFTYFYDFFKNGLRWDAFALMVGVALGSKISDSVAKKINPETAPAQ